jgi:MFS family permease
VIPVKTVAAEPAAAPLAPAGYRELVAGNPHFRRLWIAQVVSLLGDWFNTIALYTLVSRLTGSPLALGGVFLLKMLPLAVASPLAGVLVDRFDRRRVMIVSDLLRAAIVLGFLAIDRAAELPLLYLLIVAQVVAGSVFEPARSASLPNVTRPRELVTANALASATWSAMLALGAAAGGVAAEHLGLRAVFAIDSATYLVSAFFVWRTVIPQQTEAPEPGATGSRLAVARAIAARAAGKVADGWRYLRRHPPAGRMALAKASWSLGGGGLVYLLALLGAEVSPAAQATGIGVLFAVRGLGTGLGPILARRLFLDAARWPAVMGWAVALSGVAYATVAAMPWSWWVIVPVVVAHAGSGANWVLSAVELQRRTEDRFRGRAFATEWLLVTAADSVSILAASLLLEAGWLTLAGGFALCAGLQIACGAGWLLAVVPAERRWRRLDDSTRRRGGRR